MNDEYRKRYWVAVMFEQLSLMWVWLLVRLGLKKLTIDERYELKKRREFILRCARNPK